MLQMAVYEGLFHGVYFSFDADGLFSVDRICHIVNVLFIDERKIAGFVCDDFIVKSVLW